MPQENRFLPFAIPAFIIRATMDQRPNHSVQIVFGSFADKTGDPTHLFFTHIAQGCIVHGSGPEMRGILTIHESNPPFQVLMCSPTFKRDLTV
jgi:hypothetical protein